MAAHASKTLNATRRKYGQIEKEANAYIWHEEVTQIFVGKIFYFFLPTISY